LPNEAMLDVVLLIHGLQNRELNDCAIAILLRKITIHCAKMLVLEKKIEKTKLPVCTLQGKDNIYKLTKDEKYLQH